MRRSTFRRPQIERKPVVYTPAERMGVYARIDQAARKAYDETPRPAPPTPPVTRDAATKAHIDRMVACGCVVCWLLDGSFSAAEFHHPRQFAGAGQRSPDWLGFGVCPDCHRGPNGIHGDRTYLRTLNIDEAGLLAVALWRAYG